MPDSKTWPMLTGSVGLMLFAVSGFLSTSGVNIGLVLMLIALLGDWRQAWPLLSRNRLVQLSGLFVGYTFLRAGHAALEFPAHAAEQLERARELWQMAVYYPLPLAWWLLRTRQSTLRILGLIAVGFLIHLLKELDWNQIGLYFQNSRLELDESPNVLGLKLVMVLFGLLHLFGLHRPRALFRTGSATAIWIPLTLIIVVLAECLFLTRSRAAWLAWVISLVYLALIWRTTQPAYRFRCWHLIAPLFAAALLVLNGLVIGDRLGLELNFLTEAGVPASGIDTIPESIDHRLGIWQTGWHAFLARPWFGWGPGSGSLLLDQSGNTALHRYADFHNIPLQLAVGSGLVGLSLFVLIWTRLLQTMRLHTRNGGRVMGELWLGCFLILATGAGFEYWVRNPGGQFSLAVLIATALSIQLRADVDRPSSTL